MNVGKSGKVEKSNRRTGENEKMGKWENGKLGNWEIRKENDLKMESEGLVFIRIRRQSQRQRQCQLQLRLRSPTIRFLQTQVLFRCNLGTSFEL